MTAGGLAEAQENLKKGIENRNPPWTFDFFSRTLDYDRSSLMLHRMRRKLDDELIKKAQQERLTDDHNRHFPKAQTDRKTNQTKAINDLRKTRKSKDATRTDTSAL